MVKESEIRKVARARKESEKQHRVDSIINSAKKIFFSKGYLKATMEEIALGAEITKPCIYQYFKNKDDLFFSLMTPVIDDIGHSLRKVETELVNGNYRSTADFVNGIFDALYHSYIHYNDTFQIVQLFQQSGLVKELAPPVSDALNAKGRSNYRLGRTIFRAAMDQGLIKEKDVNSLVDLFWGLVVGVIQLEDIKGDNLQNHKFKKQVFSLAKELFIKSLASG